MRDIELVFGIAPTAAEEVAQCASCVVIYGTIDRSPVLVSLSEQGLIDLEERHRSEVICNAELNKVRIFTVSPGFVLEKLIIFPVGKKPTASYLGPSETYYIGKK